MQPKNHLPQGVRSEIRHSRHFSADLSAFEICPDIRTEKSGVAAGHFRAGEEKQEQPAGETGSENRCPACMPTWTTNRTITHTLFSSLLSPPPSSSLFSIPLLFHFSALSPHSSLFPFPHSSLSHILTLSHTPTSHACHICFKSLRSSHSFAKEPPDGLPNRPVQTIPFSTRNTCMRRRVSRIRNSNPAHPSLRPNSSHYTTAVRFHIFTSCPPLSFRHLRPYSEHPKIPSCVQHPLPQAHTQYGTTAGHQRKSINSKSG